MGEWETDAFARRVVDALKKKKLTLSIAESCTGGLISKQITDIPGASAVYMGGVCTYSNSSKVRLLGVSQQELEEYGAVSRQTAQGMAQGVRRLFATDVGVSVTGIAGPDSDATDKPVGLVYISVSFGENTRVLKIKNSYTNHVRENNRREAARRALMLVLEIVGE